MLRALAGNLEYLKPMIVDDDNKEETAALSEPVDSIPALVLADPKTGKFTTRGSEKTALGAALFPWPI